MALDSITNLPYVDQDTAEQAQVTLTKLAHAAAALKQGKMPTSSQLNSMAQKLMKSSLLQPELGSRIAGRVGGGKLSPKGKELVLASREVLQATVRLMLEKNPDDKIQRFLWLSSQADLSVDGDLNVPEIPTPSAKEIDQASDSLKQLFTLLLTSNNLRGLLADGVNLFRDLLADSAEQVAQAATKTTQASKKFAEKARPGEEDRKEGNLGIDTNLTTKEIKKKAIRAAEDYKDDTLKAASQKVRSVREYVDESLPTDAKDAFIERFKAIINEVQNNPEYEQAVNTLLNLGRKYANLAKEEILEAAHESTAKVETNKEAETAAKLFREIIESFTGSLEPVFQRLDQLLSDLKGDQRLQNLMDEADGLLDRAINDPGYVTTSRAQRRVETLYDQAQELVNSNAAWKADADALTSEVNKALKKAANDKALNQLGEKVERFGIALTRFGQTGLSVVDGGGIWSDLSQVFLPRILGAIKDFPLPRVEFTSEEVDLVIDNVKFTSASFIPDATHFKNYNEISCKKGYAAYATEYSTQTTLSISGLRLAAKDISYYVCKKSGWIGIEDSGLLDIIIGTHDDDGLDLTLTVENADSRDRESFFKLTKVHVDVEGFKISIHNSQHPIRNFFAQPALRAYIEKQFVAVLEEQFGAMFKAMDRQVYDLSLKAQGAKLAAPDAFAFLRAMLTPVGGAGGAEIKDTGITKVGPKGEYILNIGVEEELLPGKLTGLGRQGRDVVAKKRTAESLMEEGRQSYETLVDTVQDVTEEVTDEVRRVQNEAKAKEAEEKRKNGWKSEAFNLN